MRGTDSIANATMPCSCSRSIPSGSVSGARKPISTRAGRHGGDLLGGRPRDADDRVGAAVQLAPCPQDRTGGCVVLVEEAGCCACSAFDDDLETGSREPPDRLGYERDPAFAGGGLTRNDDAHGTNVREGISVREGNLTPRDRDRVFHHSDAGKRPESGVSCGARRGSRRRRRAAARLERRAAGRAEPRRGAP